MADRTDFCEGAVVTVEERLANCARQWRVSIDETRTTETSLLGFGTRADRAVVLKVSRKENGEEWHCGEVLHAFGGVGMIRPLEYTPGAVLLPRLRPGHDLTLLCLEGRDREATDIIASLIRRMPNVPFDAGGVGSVERLTPEFARFCEGGDGLIPMDFVDRALKWAFATTVLGILWPFDETVGVDLRASFAGAARSMLGLLE